MPRSMFSDNNFVRILKPLQLYDLMKFQELFSIKFRLLSTPNQQTSIA
jgi:hypothetical protein